MKKIIIIGGGVSGLTAGTYAQKAGFETVIYEKHDIFGGECTGWDRKNHHIDGCIHWLVGTRKDSKLYEAWCEVGALGDVEVIVLDRFMTFESDGVTLTIWRDLEKLQTEWIQVSKSDETKIKQFVDMIKSVQGMNIPIEKPMDMMNALEVIKFGMSMKEAGKVMNDMSKVSCEEYAQGFSHPALRKLFSRCMPKDYNLSSFIFTLAAFSSGNGDIPRGGSRDMAKRMEDRYVSLGGTLVCKTQVEEVLIAKGQAVGVRLATDEQVQSDYVIAACDTNTTLTKLLKSKYLDKKLQSRYDQPLDNPLASSVYISLSVDMDMSLYPKSVCFETRPYQVGESIYDSIGLRNYAYEPDFAPIGKTVLISNVMQYKKDFDYWKSLDREHYKEEKRRIANEVIQLVEGRYPELQGKISVLDVATPLTYERYCDAYEGAWMSFTLTNKSKNMMHSGKIKGLKNFYLTGQWLQPPGGLPAALSTGKFTIQRILKKEGKSNMI